MLFIVVLILTVLNIPLYFKVFKLFFKDRTSFVRAIRYVIRPDIISFFKGDLDKDVAHQFTLGVALFLCIAMTALEVYVVVLLIKLLF